MNEKELDIVLSALWFAHYKSSTYGERQKYLRVYEKLQKKKNAKVFRNAGKNDYLTPIEAAETGEMLELKEEE